MKKLSLLSRAEMKNVIGGGEEEDNLEPGVGGQCQKAGDYCTGMAPGGATKGGKCVMHDFAGILICEVT